MHGFYIRSWNTDSELEPIKCLVRPLTTAQNAEIQLFKMH